MVVLSNLCGDGDGPGRRTVHQAPARGLRESWAVPLSVPPWERRARARLCCAHPAPGLGPEQDG